MAVDALMIRFTTCNSLDTLQQWLIFKTENDRNNIRLCQGWSHWNVPQNCLTAVSPFTQRLYQMFHQIFTIEPSNEARELLISKYDQSDPSQHWLMNSTSHQLANVKYPKGCVTTRHFQQSPAYPLLLECDGYGYKSPNPELSKHQRFYQMPALDENGKQLCLV